MAADESADTVEFGVGKREARERLIRDLAVLDRKRTDCPPKDHGTIQL